MFLLFYLIAILDIYIYMINFEGCRQAFHFNYCVAMIASMLSFLEVVQLRKLLESI